MLTTVRPIVPAALIFAVTLSAQTGFAHGRGTPRIPSVWERAVTAEVIVAGKITGFDKELVKVLPHPMAKEPVAYRIATVKVDSVLVGSAKLKEIRIGVPAPTNPEGIANPQPRIGREWAPSFELKEGQELVPFLTKHSTADFYVMPPFTFPLDLKDEQGKRDYETVKEVLAINADLPKSLKGDNLERRVVAATLQVFKYRNTRQFNAEVVEVAIGVEESKRILQALIEGNWSSKDISFDGMPSPMLAWHWLGLGVKDNWIEPVIVNVPGAPPIDEGLVRRDAFARWLDGPGKDYQIKKLILKTKS